MGSCFRALLIGIGDYTDPAISGLPCVDMDMASLAPALEAAGYLVTIHDCTKSSLNGIRAGIHSFIAGACHGDTLLIYLNGHGVHHAGNDYLVPADANISYQPFVDLCLPINWNHTIEQSHAGDVIVFIDACREGFDEQAKQLSGRIGWSTGKVGRVAGRRVAYIYACSPGQVARFVHTPDGSFSLFTRALINLIAKVDRPITLADLLQPIQSQLDELILAHSTGLQIIRPLGEGDYAELVLFPASILDDRQNLSPKDLPQRLDVDPDVWLQDLAALDKARDLIDPSVHREFQRLILSKRFGLEGKFNE
ncbi:caspase family protein [Frankia sp. Cas4]|uniref:caspase family protein n=1 Tax=Frankia sp. Cas4 TaxID=3073927 RepID=UPI002AD262AC|nr:caspase family protein [Frankia sp. Cas4]